MMSSESMTSEERYQAAIRLEKPDRVPVAPLMSTFAATVILGLDYAKIMAEGPEAQLEAEVQLFDMFGGWDAFSPIAPPDGYRLGGLNVKLPDGRVQELQILETENMKEEDYDIIPELGWNKFMSGHLLPRIMDVEEPGSLRQKVVDIMNMLNKSVDVYGQRGAVPMYFTWRQHPFFQISLMRSMVKFTEDIYYRPEKVEKVMEAAVPQFIEASIRQCKASGVMVANCIEERAGAFFYPPEVFERFWWPYTQQIVDAFWSEGIVTWFHIDTCWDKNIPYFKKLPRGSAIIDLDGTTDIFRAKEILRDHLCIATDVHPALLSLGKPEEVEAYCKKLIDEVGGDGGCILTTGCTVPGAVKPENFRAFVETGKNYEFSKP
ncbi:uroporphyrinogen decarboxylase family protein [Thermodesulfobacteriota bacterium]